MLAAIGTCVDLESLRRVTSTMLPNGTFSLYVILYPFTLIIPISKNCLVMFVGIPCFVRRVVTCYGGSGFGGESWRTTRALGASMSEGGGVIVFISAKNFEKARDNIIELKWDVVISNPVRDLRNFLQIN